MGQWTERYDPHAEQVIKMLEQELEWYRELAAGCAQILEATKLPDCRASDRVAQVARLLRKSVLT